MKLLALDLGTKRTGVAFLDEDARVPVALETLVHASLDELQERVIELIKRKRIDRVIIGLPLLPSGSEGKQAKLVRAFSRMISEEGYRVELRDERYTTPRNPPFDADAAAALALLS